MITAKAKETTIELEAAETSTDDSELLRIVLEAMNETDPTFGECASATVWQALAKLQKRGLACYSKATGGFVIGAVRNTRPPR